MQEKASSLFNPNQLYEIESNVMAGMLLSVSSTQKNKMIIYQRKNGENQKFKIRQVKAGRYQITNTIQGKDYALQVPSASKQVGERIQVKDLDNYSNQYWEIDPVSNGIYTILSFKGLALEVLNSGTSNDFPVNVNNATGGKNQLWSIKPLLDLKPTGFDPNILYEIQTYLVPDMLLCSEKSGSKMVIHKRQQTERQRFKIIQLSSGKHQIVCRVQGKEYALQVPSGSKQVRERIQIRERNNHPNENWEIAPAANGLYTIKSLWGLCLDVQNSATSNNIPVIQNDEDGERNQLWLIKPVLSLVEDQTQLNPNRLYEIETNLVSGMLLSVSTGQKYKMMIYQRCGTQNQRFRIVSVGKGNYQIICRVQGKDLALQVPCASNDSGKRLQANQINSQANEYWEITSVSKGIWRIKSFNGQVVDVFNSEKSNGTHVIQFPSHGHFNQQWIIKPVS